MLSGANAFEINGIQVNETKQLPLAKTRRGLGGPDDWRIIISPMIPQGSPPCYDSTMRRLDFALPTKARAAIDCQVGTSFIP
jgi:hypothetical protein